MNPILIVAHNTFKEVIRDRILYVLLLFAVLLMGLSFAIGQLSHEEIFRLSVSLGLASIHICFVGLTIFIGSSLFFREIHSRTIYTLLVRPIHRWQYLLGKFCGLTGVLSVLLLGFMVSFVAIQLFLGLPFHMSLLVPFGGFFLEGLVLLSATFFFSTFCSPFIAVGCAVSCFLVGHWIQNLEILIEKSHSLAFRIVGTGIMYSFPDLGALNWREQGIAQALLSPVDLRYGVLVAFSWTLLLILLSHMIFRNRNFE